MSTNLKISVICCSINPKLSLTFYKNVVETVGIIDWEFNSLDNRNTGKGICQVYNEAAEDAKGEILCFVHEDVVFKTKNWGQIILKTFEETENPGVIGIAGSTLISKIPAGWYNFHLNDENRSYLYQGGIDNEKEAVHINSNPLNEKLSKVIAIDGVLMFVKRNVWQKFRFDDRNFKEFHYYDIDFSVKVAEEYNNYVSYNILIEHQSMGNLNKSWIKNTLIFEKKYRDRLPIKLNDIEPSEIQKEEELKLVHLLSNMIKFNSNYTDFGYYILRLLKRRPIQAIKFIFKRIF